MSDDKTHSVHLYINQSQYAKFRAVSLAYGLPLSTYIKNAAIRQYNQDIEKYAAEVAKAKEQIIKVDYPEMEMK